MKKIILAATVLGAATFFAKADTIALWTFETSIPTTAGPHSPEVGSGSATAVHAGAAVYSNPAGNGSLESFSANTWAIGDYYQFSTSTVGYEDITLSFDQTSSNTGPRDYGLFYSTDGSLFTQFGSDYQVLANAAPNTPWSTVTYNSVYTLTFDLSSISGLDNQAAVYFRLVNTTTTSANGGTVASTGTSRVDNFLVAGVVPEPSTAVLGALGGLFCLAMLRRRN
ncbi:MAG TPA: hypothetical protein PKA41_06875 [Verrucomicrobiota bacterium]|nr:hypothetical protein [Verrucomicrobiota bacterium]